MTHRSSDDATGKNADQRFVEIRKYFLLCLAGYGNSRTELYFRPKPGEAREATEEELVRRWAEKMAVPVNEMCIGIQRAFMAGVVLGPPVANFRECIEHIEKRVAELREARAGEGWRWPAKKPAGRARKEWGWR